MNVRRARVEGKTYSFTLSDDGFRHTCTVRTTGGKTVLYFEYCDASVSPANAERRFHADIDALVAEGGTREAMARFVFGNSLEQEEQ